MSSGISLLLNLLFLIMFFYGRDAVELTLENRPPRPGLSSHATLLNVFFNFFTAFILYMLNFRLLKTDLSGIKKMSAIVLITILAVIALSYFFSTIQINVNKIGSHPERFIRGGMMRDFFIALMVVLSSQVLYLSKKQQQIALENKTLLSENIRTRYEVLKNQVDPHFLFNSLNALNSLIKIDADKAQEYVQQLSYVFRYALQNKNVITLEEELKFTYAYGHLMQIRYGDNLQLTYRIDPKFHSYRILPLSLQTLVENAIKHNVISNKQPLVITFVSRDDNAIDVSNPVQLKKEAEDGEGIGLANLSERYRLMWKREISVMQNDGIFRVTVPLMSLEEER